MVGVFDPKAETENGRKIIRSVVSIGALVLVFGGVGLVGTSLMSSGQSDTGKDRTKIAKALPDSLTPDENLNEAPVILTSFQELEPARATIELTETLRSGETLTDLMNRFGVSRDDANAALYSLYDAEYIDPRRVLPGLEMTAYLAPAPTSEEPGALSLVGMSVKHEKEASLVVTRGTDGAFAAHELRTRLMPAQRRIEGTVESSFYEAALEAGAHDAQVYDFAQIYAYDVDFQREIHTGDRFEIVFEEYVDERGRHVRSGDILFASLDSRATSKDFYQFTPSDDGMLDYFDADGASARKFLMKTPINGARLSSNFGFRRHPISGYSKLHKGTDFAAPTGTPIYAAGNGTVERASWFGGYGNYVRITHPNGFQTAYAHMSKYGPGIKAGVKVKQGDIVGYVGSTGASTGPHLHYEVIKNGEPMNAMSLELPTGRVLDGKQLQDFMLLRAEIDKLRGVDETNTLFAMSAQNSDEDENLKK